MALIIQCIALTYGLFDGIEAGTAGAPFVLLLWINPGQRIEQIFHNTGYAYPRLLFWAGGGEGGGKRVVGAAALELVRVCVAVCVGLLG